MAHTSRSHMLDHLGLVAGMFDALGIGDVMDNATPHNPDTRALPGGEAVHARGLHGLGVLNQARSLGPRFFQNQPPSRLMAPRVTPAQLHDHALGRALDTLYAHGVPALYRRMAATAAMRLALTPSVAHRDSPSVHVDGRYHGEEAPEPELMPSTRGDRRDHRPDLNQVMLELVAEPQAGVPLLMQPLSGHRRDARAFGQVIKEPLRQLQTTSGLTSLVADSALDSADTLQQFAEPRLKWITRVPATRQAAPQAPAQAAPRRRAPLTAGYRYHALPSRDGGVERRWVLIASEPRQAHAKRTVKKPRLKQSAQEVHALKQLGRNTCAGEAEARQALAACVPGVQATHLHERTGDPTPPDGKRGRPSPGAPPEHVVYPIQGRLASCCAGRQARIEPHRCGILATKELDETTWSPQEGLNGDQGQSHAERGVRFRKEPCFLPASLHLKKPARMMALFMVMSVW